MKPNGTTTLSKEDFERFLEAIEQDEPNENLKQAIQKHNELIEGEVAESD